MAFPADPLTVTVQIALGADLTADPTTWTWTDVTNYVRVAAGIGIEFGRQDEASTTRPTKISLTVDNRDGRWCRQNPLGAWYGQLTRNTPLRVTVDPFGTGATVRGVGYIDELPARWDQSANDATVALTASGVFRRWSRPGLPARSAALRYLQAAARATAFYWPCEDDIAANVVASGLPGGQPATVGGSPQFAGDASVPGSGALLVGGAASWLYAQCVPAALDSTGSWRVGWTFKIPSDPGGTVDLVQFHTPGGPAVLWKLQCNGGTNPSFTIRGYDAAGTMVLGSPGNFSFGSGQVYGVALRALVQGVQSGGNVAFLWDLDRGDTNIGQSGLFAGTNTGVSDIGWGAGYGSTPDGWVLGHLSVNAVNVDSASLVLGWAGELTSGRVAQIATEENLTINVDDNGGVGYQSQFDTHLGTQPDATTMEVLRDVETTEFGLLYEDRATGTPTLRLRWVRYLFAAGGINLDVAAGHLGQPPEPIDDDAIIRNSWVANRPNGGSARAQLTTGPLGTGQGVLEDVVSINLPDDTLLPHVAGWVLHTTTVDELRWPQLNLNLTALAGISTVLVTGWCNATIGTRVTVANLPSQVGTDPADLLIEGWTETIGYPREWTAAVNLSPALPWQVWTVEAAGNAGRLDTSGSTLAAAATAAASTLYVATTDPAGPTWSTTDTPYDLGITPPTIASGGERVTATAVAAAVSDAFTRTTSSSWGTADSGQAWTAAGGSASDFSTSGTTGRHSQGSVNVLRCTTLAVATGVVDVDFTVDMSLPVASASGASAGQWVLARFVDTSNFYAARLLLNTSGNLLLDLVKVVTGSLTTIGAQVTVGTGHAANDLWRVRLRVVGSSLAARAWLASGADPGSWQVTATDTALTTGIALGVASRLEVGNTNTLPVVATYDNVTMISPQKFTVTRAVNGVSKAESAGYAVRLWRPAAIAL